jgi:protein-S-isoprenylcysteine O-methyltransferase Ste14
MIWLKALLFTIFVPGTTLALVPYWILASEADGRLSLGVLLANHLFVIGYEEPTLRRRFGPSYEAYCAAVPRWVPQRPRTRALSA